MRLNIQLELSESRLPKDYRRAFISLIKNFINSASLPKEADRRKEEGVYFQQLYGEGKKVDKPFTFSVYFPEINGFDSNYLNVGKKAILSCSTNDHNLFTHIYNGSKRVKEHLYNGSKASKKNLWNNHKFTVTGARVDFTRPITSDSATFKTVAPFLIPHSNDLHQYITPEDDEFDERFRYYTSALCENFLGKKCQFSYNILKYRKMVVSHFNQSMTCNKGIIHIDANPEVLNLLHHVGIGVRRSQGFGMIELVK